MSNHMYNPSRKITDVLSKYLEFDPEQVKLGIWNGHLSLTDVSLRHDAIYPLLNAHVKTTSSSAPPLRFKLLSSRIGNLELTIPWKRLVWGHGDVQVTVKNVAIVLGLESILEWEQRQAKAAAAATTPSDDNDSDAGDAESTPILFPDMLFTDDDADAPIMRDDLSPEQADYLRELKQSRLREAERRHLRGYSIGSWLRNVHKRDQQTREALLAAAAAEQHDTVSTAGGRFDSWLRSATKDFVWRFHSGLAMTIENVKIIIIQDGIELGLMLPLTNVGARKSPEPANAKPSTLATEPKEVKADNNLLQDVDDDDGEQVDKCIKLTGVGVYIRRTTEVGANRIRQRIEGDPSTKEFVLRPIDLVLSYSIFYPHFPQRQKAKRAVVSKLSRGETAATTLTVASNDASVSLTSSKRRGKRDKMPPLESNEAKVDDLLDPSASETVEHDGDHIIVEAPSTSTPQRSLSPNNSNQSPSIRLELDNQQHSEENVLSDGLSRSAAAAKRKSSTCQPLPPTMRHRAATRPAMAPLLQTEDLQTAYAEATAASQVAPRMTSSMSVSSVQVVCSSGQYKLLASFMACGTRIRNGRPPRTIDDILRQRRQKTSGLFADEAYGMQDIKSIVSDGMSDTGSTIQCITSPPVGICGDFEGTKKQIIGHWWRYALRVVIRELRRRRQVRKKFQKMFLSFDWKKQQYKRQAYIKQFMHLYLDNDGLKDVAAESALLRIEDELCIEQILLYRTLARQAYVRGYSDMPASLLDIRERQASEFVTLHRVSRENRSLKALVDGAPEGSSMMAWIEKQSGIARERYAAESVGELVTYAPYASPANMRVNTPSVMDEGTYAHTVDTRCANTKVFELRRRSHTEEMGAMRLGFVIGVEKLELLVVEEDEEAEYSLEDHLSPPVAGSLSGSDVTTTDVSVLTDDQRFFRDGGEKHSLTADGESVDDGPVPISTDFLLFKAPENVILRFSAVGIALSIHTNGTESRNFNMAIGAICAKGTDDNPLLNIGSEDDDDSMAHDCSNPEAQRIDAVVVSVISSQNEMTIQCDTSVIAIHVDRESFHNLKDFSMSVGVQVPRTIIMPNQYDDARRFLSEQMAIDDSKTTNCAVRLLGIEITLPFMEKCSPSTDDASEQNISLGSLFVGSSAMFRCGIVEGYSGAAFEALTTLAESIDDDSCDRTDYLVEPKPPVTRRLRMLQIDDLSSVMSRHWVITTSGIDCVVDCETSLYEWTAKKSLFEQPVDFEARLTLNDNAVRDRNRAKREFVVEVSTVHLLLSRDRMDSLSRLYTADVDSGDYISVSTANALLPRLDMLSHSLLVCGDIHVERMGVSLCQTCEISEETVIDAEENVQSVLKGFLRVASSFDRTFPHEEAVASAMQICIDQLTGMGVSNKDGWELANSTLLSFLEDLPTASSHRSAAHAYALNNETADSVPAGHIESAVQAGIKSCPGVLYSLQAVRRDVHEITLEFTQGLRYGLVNTYYDSYATISVHSASAFDSRGVHLLRINHQDAGDDPVEILSGNGKPSFQTSCDNSSVSSSLIEYTRGVWYQSFAMDANQPLGRGGVPLESLAKGVTLSQPSIGNRQRQILHDLEIGNAEILCSGGLICQWASVLLDVLEPFAVKLKAISQKRTSRRCCPASAAKIGWLCTSSSLSVLLASDILVPFSRLTVDRFLAKNEHADVKCGDDKRACFATCQSIVLSNLTVGGELYPDPVTFLPHSSDSPLRIQFLSDASGSSLKLRTYGLQISFLQQYLSECNQFLFSEHDGLCLSLKQVFPPRNTLEHVGKRKGILFSCEMRGTSLLIPRLSSSSDVVAFESKLIRVSSYEAPATFQMPTVSEALRRFDKPKMPDLSAVPISSDATSDPGSRSIFRTVVECRGLDLFTALGHNDVQYNSSENAIFRFFYMFDGNAECDKPVFRLREPSTGVDVDSTTSSMAADDRPSRRWKKITTVSVDLDILFDKAPHMRILLTEPVDAISNRLSLDVALSQWCLLLSIWFSNVQELPVHFPFPVSVLAYVALPPYFGASFPEFGSFEFQEAISELSSFKSEVCVHLRRLSLRCTSDKSYFCGSETLTENISAAISLEFQNPVIHVANDYKGISRIGSGCTDAGFVDEGNSFQTVLDVRQGPGPRLHSWADLTFGLRDDYRLLTKQLPQLFQFNICMTPKWTLYNLGIGSAESNLSDFSSIFRLLEFVSSYFSDQVFGHPSFDAVERNRELKSELYRRRREQGKEIGPEDWDLPGNNIDFRLWLVDPRLSVPCDPFSSNTPGVRAETSGLWYHYTSLRTFTVQEIVARNMGLFFDERCISAGTSRARSSTDAHRIVDGLSFGLRLDFNCLTNHSGYAVQIPFDATNSCSLISPMISVLPVTVGPETICRPFEQPERYLGKTICDITFIFEVMPMISTAILKLLGKGADDSDPHSADESDDRATSIEPVEATTDSNMEPVVTSFSFTGDLKGIRLFILDPVLGPHLPVGVMSVASIAMTVSQLADLVYTLPRDRNSIGHSDLNVMLETVLWMDYFKLGQTRSWEPLVEPYRFSLLHEKSVHRGSGIALSSDVPLHVNISGALLVIIDEVIDSFRRLISQQIKRDSRIGAQLVVETKQVIEETSGSVKVSQELPAGLNDEDRVAFSLRNLTGQKIRLRKPDSGSKSSRSTSTVVSYLRHTKSSQLLFRPSISIIRNMSIADVDFPGLRKGTTAYDIQNNIAQHAVDLQVPGFRWLQDIKVDAFGKSFANIIPQLPELGLKGARDWRLGNVFKLLVEVGLQNGGRQVTVKSLFSILNRTSHGLSLALHPDPAFEPNLILSSNANLKQGVKVEEATIRPGETFQVPTLLIESSLRQPGSHIGSLWLRPDTQNVLDDKVFEPYLRDDGTKGETSVKFSSRPIQLAKIVSESALIFDTNQGRDVSQHEAQTGMQVACPVVVDSSERLSPFCYAVEVSRSPLVKAPPRGDSKEKIHGPVAYTLSLYPTFVIANLLPQKGRFELMHAIRHHVVWYADLEPGQLASVHSVGLDAPLLLLINLGFCKTPVGEGVLVHHGSDQPRGAVKEGLAGLKSIGKAGKAVTKQLGKTLTKIGDSPDKRGHEKLLSVQNPQFTSLKSKEKETKTHSESRTDLGLDTASGGMGAGGGKTYRTDTAMFFPQDVAAETSVVDSLGQRLTLSIENVRGGGGQRRISIFSPFWIVNTTEHSLRYKQEKGKSFVSGTVSGPGRDGSEPLSGGHAQAYADSPQGRTEERVRNRRVAETIFSGTAGALAASPGHCDLVGDEVAALIEADLPIAKLAELAFMFNFNDGMLSLGHQKICVQLWDGSGITRYASDWSQGFSLDSVGYSQIVSMHCRDGRTIELTTIVTLAPGTLSGYTKIVRFLPRYLVVNALPSPIRLWQDSSIFRPPAADNSGDVTTKDRRWRLPKDRSKRNGRKVNQYEALWGRETILDDRYGGQISSSTRAHPSALYVSTAGPSEIIPFNLPDTRAERLLRLDLGGDYNLTASISADTPGDHTLKVTKAVDLKSLPHVVTRASSEYEVRLPLMDSRHFTSELGIWFETEWENEKTVTVKAVKKDSFAFNDSDVHIGDELLSIDGVPVSRMTFSETMNKIRSRMSELAEKSTNSRPRATLRRASIRLVSSAVGLGRSASTSVSDGEMMPFVLRFRTVEDRLRRLRMKASVTEHAGSSLSKTGKSLFLGPASETESALARDVPYVKAELRAVQHSLFLIVKEEALLPYRIENRSVASTIYFRQRGCSGHPWQQLKPGQSDVYAWEEPLKPKRLSVRVGMHDALMMTLGGSGSGSFRARQNHKWQPLLRQIKHEEDAVFSAPVTVRLEEIGFKEVLVCAGTDGASARFFELTIDVSGATRVLTIQDASGDGDDAQLLSHLQSLERTLADEERRLASLKELGIALQQLPDDSPSDPIVDESQKLMVDFPMDPMATRRHQLVVHVLEANGLSTDTLVGSSNPYAEVSLSGPRNRQNFLRAKPIYKTYYIKKTVNPSWNSQTFTFDVPPEAVDAPRGHSLTIRIRNFRALGNNKTFGKAQVELHNLRDQKPVIGWFPLAGKTGRHELDSAHSHWGRGSVRISIQWIHSSTSLLNYFSLLSEERLLDLNRSLKGLKQQRRNKRAVEDRRQDTIDGFQRVRVHDLVSFSTQRKKYKRLTPPKPLSKEENVAEKQLSNASRAASLTRSFSSRLMSSPLKSKHVHTSRDAKIPIVQMIGEESNENRKPAASATNVKSMKPSRKAQAANAADSVIVQQFYFWSASNALFQDQDLSASVENNEVVVRLKELRPAKRSQLSDAFDKSEPTASRLCLPAIAPSSLVKEALDCASFLRTARFQFDRASRRKTDTVLHHGGWLVIRPHAALNLSDSYTGMFVRVSFGPETLVSETVDAKITPTWNEKAVSIDHESFQYGANDMLIHIAPRKTSGFIRLSVFGEKSHPNLGSKTELGVLHLPLGSTISACIDCANGKANPAYGTDSSSAYSKWFPLMDPKDIVPVEGDWGLSCRPPDSEKESDSMFKEYFAPCIQLSLIWFADDETTDANEPVMSYSFAASSDHSTSKNSEGIVDTDMLAHMEFKNELRVQTYFYADIGRLSFALIDSQRAFELLSLSVSDADFRYWTTRAKTRFGASIGWLQVDQQDDNAREPVVLAPTPMDYVGPVIQALAVKDNVRSVSEVVSFDFVDVSIAEFDLTIEESILFDVFDFINSVRLRRGFLVKASQTIDEGVPQSMANAKSIFEDEVDIARGAIISLLHCGSAGGLRDATKVYIEQLFLGVVKVNLSYLKGKKQAWELTSQGGFVEKKSRGRRAFKNTEVLVNSSSLFHGSSDALMNWAQHTSDEEDRTERKGKASFPQLLATLLPNVSDAPIRLQGKALNHIFERPNEIILSIKKYYVNETLRQIYRIIGSLDFVGNPTMLFNSFFSGVRDLVLTPSQAFMRSPTDASGVGLGIAKGTLSLFSYCASGFFGFSAKLTATAGQGIAWMSLDEDYRLWHRDKIVTEVTNLSREWKRRGVQSATAMLVRPVADVLFGVVFGISGIIVAPVKGLQRDGSVGLLKGVASGLIGVVAKPLVGVLDSLTHFSASIHDIAKSVNVLDKRRQPALKLRLPYTFGFMYVLAPFERTVARASVLLKRYPVKKSVLKHLKFDEVILHVEVLPNVSGDTYMILTSIRVIVIRARKDASGSIITSLCWEVSLARGAVVSSRLSEHGHNGVALTLTMAKHQQDSAKLVSFDIQDDVELDDKEDLILDGESQGALSELPTESEALTNRLGFDLDGDGQFHGTGTGDTGELVEWYTIVAEYENRAQLARLHNAVSCLTENFEAIIFDPSLGHAADSEGYTTFGMYHFSPIEPQQQSFSEENRTNLMMVLDTLPWIDENTFQSLNGKPPSEQRVRLQELRQNFSLLSEVESSRKEGGPEWLVTARARVMYDQNTWTRSGVHADDETDDAANGGGPLSASQSGKSRFSKFKKWAASPLPSIADGFLETGVDMLPFLRKKDRRKKSELSLSDDPSQELFKDFGSRRLSTEFVNHQRESRSTEQLPTWNEDDSETLTIGQPDNAVDHTRCEMKTKNLAVPRSGQQGADSILKNLRSRTPFLGSESKKMLSRSERDTGGPPVVLRVDKEAVEGRMERMEKLMERLLIFSSEQALRNPDSGMESGTELQGELLKVRDEMKQQSAKSRVSEEDVKTTLVTSLTTSSKAT